ncbi:NAD(P)-dependent oxidoreductase [Sphingomonas sp. SUN039]|uniref:NAD(P)-dependent oxidoreductase n=1 Tax=Sphingomonas sp. SUN039 TaxID=2937787 RepID=UPI0021642683|nr:NAD(P)-dependent oxidoreductase [Sphingomonas sp. SUN039]UVO52641.1 NAD(P)-dependent oxidoreductase [Sphingomonas sp. SUN039]
MKIGYIGLGSLGSPIARCIARGGFPLTVYDIVPAAMEGFISKAASPQEAAFASDVLCACVRTDADMVELTQSGSVFAALGAGGVFIVHSTIAPELAEALSAQAARHGVAVLDCGVSRGGGGAEVNGDLSIYLGGDAATVEKVKPLLDCLGTYQLLGPVGSGMKGKLLNNLVSIANYGMAAHILELGEHLGFDRAQLREMLMAGSAQGFAMRVAPGFVSPERAPNMLTLFDKDVAHARALADPSLPSMKALLAAAQSMVDLLAEKAKPQP